MHPENPSVVWHVLDRLIQQEQRAREYNERQEQRFLAHTERLEQRLREQSEQMQQLIASQLKHTESQARKNLAFPAPTDFSNVPKLEKNWHTWENNLTTWLTARSLSPLAEWIFALHDEQRRQLLEDYFHSASMEVRPMLISDTHRLLSNILNASAAKLTAYQNMKQTLGSSHPEVSDPYKILKNLHELFANVADDKFFDSWSKYTAHLSSMNEKGDFNQWLQTYRALQSDLVRLFHASDCRRVFSSTIFAPCYERFPNGRCSSPISHRDTGISLTKDLTQPFRRPYLFYSMKLHAITEIFIELLVKLKRELIMTRVLRPLAN
mmetsp:Transcript_33888/g.76145  ORF Transcript_33888/g.76145 Transcript_33888/m.76145 type:complete len:323 (-) Transcript_33888:6839-7807(-)